jgi:uncharacterized membrane protein
MTLLILGLVIFLGVHSVRIVADDWRRATIARIGPGAWKGVYSLLSLAGLVLIVWGYGDARLAPTVLWGSPVWVKHLASLLTLLAFVLLAAAYVPGNHLKARLHHPMVLAVKLWAFAHLVSNNTLADLLLFGSFLLWAVLDFRAGRARDRAQGTVYLGGHGGRTAATVVVGVGTWALFAFWLHGLLFGVRPFG